MVSVVLTTHNGASSLRGALGSVKTQAARAAIKQVIVADTGQCPDARDVCDEFGDFPITYFRQNASVTRLNLWKIIWHLVENPLVAFLHDDSRWCPEHLAVALEVFSSKTHCAATYSNFYETDGWGYPVRVSRKAWKMWLATGCNFADPILSLDEISVILASLLDSTLHLSTLIGRREPIGLALTGTLARGEGYTEGRILGVDLISLGPIGYFTLPSATICEPHGVDGEAREVRTQYWDSQSATTKWLLRTQTDKVKMAAAKFNRTIDRLADLPPVHEAAPNLSTALYDISGSQWEVLWLECGLNLLRPAPPPVRNAKWLLKQLCPPGLLSTFRSQGYYYFKSK